MWTTRIRKGKSLNLDWNSVDFSSVTPLSKPIQSRTFKTSKKPNTNFLSLPETTFSQLSRSGSLWNSVKKPGSFNPKTIKSYSIKTTAKDRLKLRVQTNSNNWFQEQHKKFCFQLHLQSSWRLNTSPWSKSLQEPHLTISKWSSRK